MNTQSYTVGYGRRVRMARDQCNWKQNELAERSGIPQQEISRIEAGKVKNVNVETLMALAKTLDKPPGWLLFGVENIDTISLQGFKIAAAWESASKEKQLSVAMELMPTATPQPPDIDTR